MRKDLMGMAMALGKIKNPLKRSNKVKGQEVVTPNNTNLKTFEVDFKPSDREKVLIEANKAVNNKKVSWRESKGKFLGMNLGLLKNKAKAKLGNKDYNSKGQCTNNTCVETVADYHKSANVPFSKTSDNRTLKKELNSNSIGYNKTISPKKGDIVQFEKNKKSTKNRPFHVGVVSDINKKGRPTKYIGTSGHNSPNLKRGVTRELSSNQKETRIKKKHSVQYYTKNA